MNSQQTSLWKDTQDRLKSFVFKRTRDKAVTDDIVQDVFIKVYSRIGQVKDSDKLLGWIFQITRNTIADYFRDKQKVINAQDIDWESDRDSLNDCVSSCLSDMMFNLPDKYREALELTELKNLSQTQLATTLNISYSGAKSRVQRARQMLREMMEHHYKIKFDGYGNVTVCENRLPCGCSRTGIDA